MKHKLAQLKTEITINQIKTQREQRRKNKKTKTIVLFCTMLFNEVVEPINNFIFSDLISCGELKQMAIVYSESKSALQPV